MKKPVSYNFLDFSTLEKRKHFCWEELRLNRRLAPRIYIDVLPLTRHEGKIQVACTAGEIIDYAVLMQRMPGGRQMDLMLKKEVVSRAHVEQVAKTLAHFHQRAEVFTGTTNDQTLWRDFEDLGSVLSFLEKTYGSDIRAQLSDSLEYVKDFLRSQRTAILDREKRQLVRDVHGDLHTKNIFLLKEPVIFDCIEFNPDLRRIDVLCDIAFLILDLLYYGRKMLADHFLVHYLKENPVVNGLNDYQLFLYYCLYRANVKIKVYSLKARQEEAPDDILRSIRKYLRLYTYFLRLLKGADTLSELPQKLLPDKYQVPE